MFLLLLLQCSPVYLELHLTLNLTTTTLRSTASHVAVCCCQCTAKKTVCFAFSLQVQRQRLLLVFHLPVAHRGHPVSLPVFRKSVDKRRHSTARPLLPVRRLFSLAVLCHKLLPCQRFILLLRQWRLQCPRLPLLPSMLTTVSGNSNCSSCCGWGGGGGGLG